MTSKIEILCQNFAHFGGIEGSFLTILGVKKVVFWTFKVVLEYFNPFRIIRFIADKKCYIL